MLGHINDRNVSAEQRIQACFHALVENTPKAAEALKQGLRDDPSPIVRHECAYSLGEMDPELGYQALLTAIKQDDNPFVIHEAALAVSNLGIAEAEPLLQSLLDHNNADVVRTAKISLQRLQMRLNEEVIRLEDAKTIILDLDQPEEYRIQASFLLMEEGSLDSVAILIKALQQETDPIVKHEIIFSLGETAASTVIEPLVHEMLTDNNPFVKHEAALALATIGNLEARQPIQQLLDHNHPAIVESAEIALERLTT